MKSNPGVDRFPITAQRTPVMRYSNADKNTIHKTFKMAAYFIMNAPRMLNPPIRFILVRETNMIFTCRVCESLTKSLWTCSLTSSSVCSLCALSFSSNTWLSRAVCKNPNAHPVGQKSVVTGVRASSFHWRVLCGFWTPSAIGFDIAQFQGVRFIWLGSPIQFPPPRGFLFVSPNSVVCGWNATSNGLFDNLSGKICPV